MKTFLAQNQFTPHVPDGVDEAASLIAPHEAAALLVSVAAAVPVSVSVSPTVVGANTGLAPLSAPASDATDHIHEIFHYVRKLMKGHHGFILDEARFLADIDETPLFLREDGYLHRREA